MHVAPQNHNNLKEIVCSYNLIQGRNKMKKQFAATILLILTIGIITGCSRKSGDELMMELNNKVNNLTQAQDYDKALSELNRAMGKKAYKPYLSSIYQTTLNIQLQANKYDGFITSMSKAINVLPENQAYELCEQLFFQVLETRSAEEVKLLIDTIQKAPAGAVTIIARTEVYRLHLLAKNNEWEQVEQNLKTLAPKLDDAQFSILLNRITERATANGHPDVTEKLCEHVINACKDMPRSINTAANRWIEISVNAGDIGKAQQKISALLEKTVSLDIIYSQFSRHFHKLISTTDKNIINNLSDIGRKIIQMDTQNAFKENLKTCMLDLAFLSDDFDAAIAIIESGIPSRDETWHKLAISKLKAHKFLKENNRPDAIKYFREFMAVLKEINSPETDPTTGIMHTVNMTLGLNTKRIGDIMKEMNDLDGAKKAYEEALSYYQSALAETQNQPKSQDFIKKKLEELSEAMK